ncbi:MAG TPA: cupin domain-containing protein [Acidimicrobiales bacterium]|nr:cupin domain-containing protein [Acidimicrobiales bacterium]
MTTALGRCVGDTGRFLAEHWSVAPLHLPGAGAGAFADLLTLDDVDRIVSSSLPRTPSFRLVRDGHPLDPARYTRPTTIGGRPVTGAAHAGLVWKEFSAGATIVLQSLQRTWPALAAFCRDLELELTHPVQANAYVTPPAARGLAVHHDTHDVLVLQVAGSKRWAVHPPVLELPLRTQPWKASMGPPAEPLLDVELRAGDSLYVPRGFPHSARAQDGVSIHLTVGVLAWTGEDVAREVVRRAADHLPLRRAMPVGFADDEDAAVAAVAAAVAELRDWLGTVDPEAVARGLTTRFWSTRPAVLAGQLRQLCLVDGLDDSTVVRRRPAAVCRLSRAGSRLVVTLGDRVLRMPAALEPPMRRLVAGEPLSVADLDPWLDMQSRHVLARRLVREGLLEIVAAT